jgi:hypothetical protein
MLDFLTVPVAFVLFVVWAGFLAGLALVLHYSAKRQQPGAVYNRAVAAAVVAIHERDARMAAIPPMPAGLDRCRS